MINKNHNQNFESSLLHYIEIGQEFLDLQYTNLTHQKKHDPDLTQNINRIYWPYFSSHYFTKTGKNITLSETTATKLFEHLNPDLGFLNSRIRIRNPSNISIQIRNSDHIYIYMLSFHQKNNERRNKVSIVHIYKYRFFFIKCKKCASMIHFCFYCCWSVFTACVDCMKHPLHTSSGARTHGYTISGAFKGFGQEGGFNVEVKMLLLPFGYTVSKAPIYRQRSTIMGILTQERREDFVRQRLI